MTGYGGHALAMLRMLGLFDRPVPNGAIDALKAGPVIPGVTEHLHRLSEEDWQYALKNLESANLLAEYTGNLDCHPLVREYFGSRLREQNPGGLCPSDLIGLRLRRKD